MIYKRFDSSENNVWKYVFDFGDAISEAVLYRYESFHKRTVLCISVQSGCPVGCKFCGTGKKFIRNLNYVEIIEQVNTVLKDMDIETISSMAERFQIMFMSMGEPFLNYEEVSLALNLLNKQFPNAELLISTMAPRKTEEFKKFIKLSWHIDKIGLQFSIHEAFDDRRNELIPFKNKYNLREIRDIGTAWNKTTGRPVYINYCISNDNYRSDMINRLMDLFSKEAFNFTFSVICSADENMKSKGYKENDKINEIVSYFTANGYNTRMFDPAGQDDIGGGCGQLWYVQDWLKNRG